MSVAGAHSVIMACNNKKPIQDQLVLERGSSNKVKNTSVARGRRTGYGVIIDLDDSDDEMPTRDGTTSVPNVVASGFILSGKEIGSAHFHQTGDENGRSCTANRLLDSSTKRKRGPRTNIDVSKNDDDDDDDDDDMTPISKLKTKATQELITDVGDGSDSADSSSDIESMIKKLRSRNDNEKTWQQLRKGQSVNGSSLTKNQGFTAFDLMSMDGVGDELATIDAVDNTLLQSKDEGKNPERGCVSERPSASIHCVDDAGVMAEELTLQNFKNENIAIVSTSSNRDAIISNAWEDVGYTVFPELLGPKPPDDVHNDNVEHVLNNEIKAVASNPFAPPGGIRTKILSKSGFSEYFVKNTLKSKGVIFKGSGREGFGAVIRGQMDSKASSTAMVAFNAPLSSSTKTVVPPSHDVARPGLGPNLNAFHDGVSLREWLKAGQYKANKVNSFHIFRQIVGLVDISHAKGVASQDLRPSCFKLLPSNQVIYLGSCVRHETAENSTDQDSLLSENDRNEKRPLEQAMHPAVSERIKKQKFGENLNFIRQWHQFPSRSSFKTATANDTDVSIAGPKDSWNELNKEHNLRREYKSESNYSRLTPQLRSTYASDPLEEKKWYTSPEELSGKGCTFS
ncbi:hypothetical protein ACSBR1_041765 [Camellia fascicularis]